MSKSPFSWREGRPILTVSTLTSAVPLTEWLAIGPFPLEISEDLGYRQQIGRADIIEQDSLGGEGSVRPVEGQRHPNPALAEGLCSWTRLSGQWKYDFYEVYAGHQASLAYAATYLQVETPTNLMFKATGADNWFLATIQVFLDGVEIGHGDEPIWLQLSPGTHCLMLKLAGGKKGETVWRIDAVCGPIQSVGAGLHAGLVQAPGFWRGTETDPRVEIAVALLNVTSEPVSVAGVSASLAGEKPGASSGSLRLAAGQAQELRLDAPLGRAKPGDAFTVAVTCGGEHAAFQVVVPALPTAGVIHIVEGFHCDPVWVSAQHHYNLISLGNVRQLIDGCLADPSYRVFLHEIDYLKPFVDEFSDYRSAVFDLVKRGQVCLGSSYNQPNENNCSGEALIRNLIYGHSFHGHFLGGNPEVYHAWDVFGHIPQLSQILAKSGIIGVVWSKMVRGFPAGFRHMALDGTLLPHNRTDYGWATRSLDHLRVSAEPMLGERRSVGQRRFLAVDAADFFPPSPWMIGRGQSMEDSFPKVVMSDARDFFKGLDEDGVKLPVTSRNPSQYHIGTQHSRVELKIANRLCENQLAAAECWATFAALMGATYPDWALDKAWRQVLFGQHHDALTGTPCDISYLDLMSGYRDALDLAQTVTDRATQFLADAVQIGGNGQSVVAFNNLNWARSGIVTIPNVTNAESVEVRDADGEPVPCAVENGVIKALSHDIPGIGYTTLSVHPGAAVEKPKTAPHDKPVIENEFWRIELDPSRGGGIARLTDKHTGREVVNGAAAVENDLVMLREKGDRVEPSWEFWTTGEKRLASEAPADVKVHESPVGQTAIITGQFGETCSYRRTLTVRPGQRAIEATVEIRGYRGQDDLFAMTVKPALGDAAPIFEDRFGTIVARRGKTKFDYRTSTNNIYSDCAIYPVYNWVEAGWSACVNVGKTPALNLGPMGLVIPHDSAVADATEPLLRALAHRGITTTLYYDDDDRPRRQKLDETYPRSRFGPGRDTDDTLPNRLDDLAMCAQWMVVSVAGDNAYLEELLDRLPDAVRATLRGAEEKHGCGLVIVEDTQVPEGWSPMPVILASATSESQLIAALNAFCNQLADTGCIELPDGADFRSRPGAVEDYGVALLTTGTGAATMEPDGTLTLFLTHTSQWSASYLSDPLVPEHRDMIFHYCIYPHAGSWREGGVVRAGYEFANPLVAIAPKTNEDATKEAPRLPRSQRFLSLDAPGTVVTAIKPAGNPVPRFEHITSDPQCGIIVRAYEAHGANTAGRVTLMGKIKEAHRTNLMEEVLESAPVTSGHVSWSLSPFAIETMKLIPRTDDWPNLGRADLGPVAEAVQPVWCRHWKHNAGAHPMGFLPVGIFLDGELPLVRAGGSQRSVDSFRVSIINNYTDHTIGGVARLTAPAQWRLFPSEVHYTLGPREHVVQTITVAYDRPPRTGLIKGTLEFDGQTYQDVIEVGQKTDVKTGLEDGLRGNEMVITKERGLAWDVVRDGEAIRVRVTNPWQEPVDAELALISPVETWGWHAGRHALTSIAPGRVGVPIPGRQQYTAHFEANAPGGTPHRFWAWVKLSYHGAVFYRPVPAGI